MAEAIKAATGNAEAVNRKPEQAEDVKPEKGKPDTEERVEIRLIKDSGQYKYPEVVGVNGKKYLVPRGKRVSVPKSVAEVLENSMIQMNVLADFVEEKSFENTVPFSVDV